MGLFGRGKVTGEAVMERGERASGRLVGIHVSETSGAGDSDTNVRVIDYAVEVAGGDRLVAGLRQHLQPLDVIRLGMPVQLRRLQDRVALDWAATCGGRGGVPVFVKQHPPDGITDETLGLKRAQKKGVAGVATVNAATVRDAMMGLARVLHLDLTVRADGLDAYDVEVGKVEVPFYATHLVEVGTALPCWVRPNRLDRVTIDWPAAAAADPGIDRPPSPVLDGIGNVLTGTPSTAASVAGGVEVSPAAATPDGPGREPINGVSFDQWVAVEAGLTQDRVPPDQYDAYAQRHGVAAGSWAAGRTGWEARMRSDWRLGAAFGEAVEAAKKNRR
jgi:hypothetical protein